MINNKKWCSIWGNAVSILENKPEGFSKNITLRYPIYSAFSGSQIKITLDNFTGTEPITVSRATILYGTDFYEITFDGKKDIEILPGNDKISDPVDVNINAGQVFYVNLYFADYTQMRASVYVSGPLSGGQYAIGDMSDKIDWDINISRKTGNVYFLSDVSLYTDENNRALLCYGDSITAQDWPDYLALRCRDLGASKTSVIRKATSGSRILRQYSCITYESYGLMSTLRFPHEVPSNGVDTIILQQGINDIIHPVGTDINPFRPMSDLPTSEELINGFKWYIEQARSLGLKVYAGTLLPIKGWRTYADFREELKNDFNDFLRTTDLIDGCIDFDLALRDPSCPEAFLPQYDSGDHLHPSAAGYKAMADAVPGVILL